MKHFVKLTAVLCCVLMLTACGSRVPVEQESVPTFVSVEIPAESFSSETDASSEPVSVPEPVPAPDPLCTAYALYCIEDDEMLDSYEIDKRIAPASLTKMLTASVVLKYLDPDDVVTVGTELQFVQPDSSLCWIAEGERLTVKGLLYGLLLPSGNDAAYTFAVNTARRASGKPDMNDRQAVAYFCRLMNQMAGELGMNDSHFADPDGWDDPDHYTTVSDLIKIAKYSLTVPVIREIIATAEVEVEFETGEYAYWYNGNLLLREDSRFYNEYAIGMKTGATDDAGYCMISVFEKNNKTYLDIVVGSEEIEDRYEKIAQLFDKIP